MFGVHRPGRHSATASDATASAGKQRSSGAGPRVDGSVLRRRSRHPARSCHRVPPSDAAAVRTRPPAFRCLRAYSIDPSLTMQLDTALISEITFKIPWEALSPGPVGEYLEVIDVDPASGCYYEPVDLDDPTAGAGRPRAERRHAAVPSADGLCRGQADHPQFRAGARPPQSVAPRPSPSRQDRPERRDVRPAPADLPARAARGRTPTTRPDKIALLFGYFEAAEHRRRDHMPGGMVFTCLSHDIVAHETTHALLDGMHRRFLSPTNPDVLRLPRGLRRHRGAVPALHVLRHPAPPDRRDARRPRGRRRTCSVSWPGQFGRSHRAARRAARRDRHGRWRDAGNGSHASRIRRRTRPRWSRTRAARSSWRPSSTPSSDLRTAHRRPAPARHRRHGRAAAGAIHPDLVARLAAEAAKTAQHVLRCASARSTTARRSTSRSASSCAPSSPPTPTRWRMTTCAIGWPSSRRSASGASIRVTCER